MRKPSSALPQLPAIERGIRVAAFAVREVEYFLSPGGALRKWLRLNLGWAVFLLIVLPPAGCLALVALRVVTLLPDLSAALSELGVRTLQLAGVLFVLSTACIVLPWAFQHVRRLLRRHSN